MVAANAIHRTLLFLLMFSYAGIVTGHSDSSNESHDHRLHVVFDRSHFSDMNPSDAAAALKIWCQEFADEIDVEMDIDISSYDTMNTLAGFLERQEVDLVIINAKKYLQLDENYLDIIDPVFTTTINDGKSFGFYHLLANTDSGISGWKDCINKDLLLLKSYRCHLLEDWFIDSLRKADVPQQVVRVEEVDSVSKAILPVFFGNADACVVSDEAFQVMKELNPQIGKKLISVQTSPTYLEILLCIWKGYTDDREVLLDSVADMHMNPSGKQVMMLFRIAKLIEFQESFLENSRNLLYPQRANTESNN